MTNRPDDNVHDKMGIVPAHEEALSLSHHGVVPQRRERVRTWPLYLLFLTCLMGLIACAIFFWLERQHWHNNAAELQSQITQLNEQLADVENTTDAANESFAKEVQRLEAAVSEQNKRVNQWVEVSASSEQMSRLTTHVMQLEQAGETRQDTLAALQQSLDALESVLNQTRQDMETGLTSLRHSVSVTEQKVNDQNNRLASITEHIEAQDRTINELQEQQRKGMLAEEHMDQLDEQVTRLQQYTESLRSEDEQIKTRLQQLHNKQISLAAEQEMLNSRLSGAFN